MTIHGSAAAGYYAEVLWICVVAAVIAISAGVSLATDVHTRARLRSGKAGYDDIADHTGIWSKEELARLPGVRLDADGELRVDAEAAVRLPQTTGKRLLDAPLGNIISIALAVLACLAAMRSSAGASCILVLVGVYQLAAWVWAAVRVRQGSR